VALHSPMTVIKTRPRHGPKPGWAQWDAAAARTRDTAGRLPEPRRLLWRGPAVS
jgi:hypothetical protein